MSGTRAAQPPQPTLTTERLRLVPLADTHLEFEVELDSDPEVMRYLTGTAQSRTQVERSHLRRLAAAHEVDGLGFWVGITDADAVADADAVGWWILRPPNGPDQVPAAGEAELGYRLLRRYWRRGFASEGAAALLRYGFEDVGLSRIFAQTMAVNDASRATMASLGMSFVRGFTSAASDPEPVDGAEQGEVEYEITRAAWTAAQQLRTAAPRRTV